MLSSKSYHASVVAFNANGDEKDTTIHYGARPVRLPEDSDFLDMHEKDLRLVVVRGFGQCAMLILTTLQGDGSKGDAPVGLACQRGGYS